MTRARARARPRSRFPSPIPIPIPIPSPIPISRSRPRSRPRPDPALTSAGRARVAPPLTDEEVDALRPPALWSVAPVHFTPVAVPELAAGLLAPAPGSRVLDVGSGVGKFCVVAARAWSRSPAPLALRLGVTNVEFVVGDALAHDWSGFDGFYLFNPSASSRTGARPRSTARPGIPPRTSRSCAPPANS